ncbi:MAG: HPr family phosphocarrier protein [Candidatus Aureabacteria bacterium]|nr:HPr family phosphocarrier protein [Candidatus Auribacterota bacterium]
MKKISKTIVIENKLGLHARPAAQLVQLAGKFSSEILFARGEETVNAKSIMGVLMLAAPQGTTMKRRLLSLEGVDCTRPSRVKL